jgi:tRNA pseudouridine55 synthase
VNWQSAEMAKREAPFGFFNIDKPSGVTSHDVVAQMRRKLGVKKVGHAGTLDPLATGVLVVCVGDATRLAEYVMATTKVYQAKVHLGVETTTYDAEGEITARCDVSQVTRDDVKAILPEFTGNIDQVPPIYSALKKGGRKLYELARAGETVELESRAVIIESLALTNWEPPFFTLDIVCGSGTYIRSMAHDVGVALGVCAHLADLRRTRSGAFMVDDAVNLDDLLHADDPLQWLTPAAAAMRAFPAVRLSPADVEDIRHGRPIHSDSPVTESVGIAIAPDGRMVAILTLEGGLARPHKVFSSQFSGS